MARREEVPLLVPADRPVLAVDGGFRVENRPGDDEPAKSLFDPTRVSGGQVCCAAISHFR